MNEMIRGFYWGFGFFWGLIAGLSVAACFGLLLAVIMGGLADRYQRKPDYSCRVN